MPKYSSGCKYVKTSCSLPEPVYKKLRRESIKRHFPMSHIIIEALEMYYRIKGDK